LEIAKTRLAPMLPSQGERALLAEAMFRDVLSAALGAKQVDRAAVVTSDRLLITIAQAAGALIIDEEFPRGLNVAVGIATEALSTMGAAIVATVLSDTPLITGEDIDAALVALPDRTQGVVLVPSRDFSGTNIMVRMPPGLIGTQFGRFSLVRHREDCRHRGIRCEVIRLMRPALDLDTPEDLLEFAHAPTITHTYNHLARLGLIHA
jgi:2-phospho-L-lactate guanylyltransferase